MLCITSCKGAYHLSGKISNTVVLKKKKRFLLVVIFNFGLDVSATSIFISFSIKIPFSIPRGKNIQLKILK